MPAPLSLSRLLRLAVLCVLALAAVTGLQGCGDDSASDGKVSGKPLRVGVSPVPHGEILRYVRDHLAAASGLNLEIEEYTDYVLPNTDLEKGDLDANYFQIPAYLKQAAKADDAPLVEVVGVHIEPLGLYSRTVKDTADIPAAAEVALPAGDVTVTRSLRLLAAGRLITLRDPDATSIGVGDITANPKRLRFDTVDASDTPRALDDHTLAVINGNYALEAGLKPAEDALLLEQAAGNPNVNLLATLANKRDDPRIEKLAQLLRSPQVHRFITDRYQGAVIPAP